MIFCIGNMLEKTKHFYQFSSPLLCPNGLFMWKIGEIEASSTKRVSEPACCQHLDWLCFSKISISTYSTLKRCQTQSLVWWWLDQKGANSPNILHSHLYWHPTIHSCLAKISWSGFEHGSNADDNHCTLMHFFPISKRY